jgi:tRNA (guanine37-N1)-methyltransferase
MQIHVVTLFPEMLREPLAASVLGKGIERGLLDVSLHDLRPFGDGRHQTTDDAPYGGGAGMVMRVEPLVRCLESLPATSGTSRALLLSPQGRRLDMPMARELARLDRLVLVCGRYEGVDERVTHFVDGELSIGDYVMSGGEPAALVVIDVLARLLPGVLGNEESAAGDSFEDGVLEFPQYTRPAVFRGLAVPEVLLSGDHARVRRWRRREALRRTRERRPDLFAHLRLSDEDRALLEGDEP